MRKFKFSKRDYNATEENEDQRITAQRLWEILREKNVQNILK